METGRRFQAEETAYAKSLCRRGHGKAVVIAEGRERRRRCKTRLETHAGLDHAANRV